MTQNLDRDNSLNPVQIHQPGDQRVFVLIGVCPDPRSVAAGPERSVPTPTTAGRASRLSTCSVVSGVCERSRPPIGRLHPKRRHQGRMGTPSPARSHVRVSYPSGQLVEVVPTPPQPVRTISEAPPSKRTDRSSPATIRTTRRTALPSMAVVVRHSGWIWRISSAVLVLLSQKAAVSADRD